MQLNKDEGIFDTIADDLAVAADKMTKNMIENIVEEFKHKVTREYHTWLKYKIVIVIMLIQLEGLYLRIQQNR